MDHLEDKKKELEHTLSDLETLIADLTEKIATTADEIKALEDGIVKLDKDVAEATETRKEENDDFKDLMASDTAAKEIIVFAQISMHRDDVAPPPPPEAVGAYKKKGEDSAGVIAMMDTMVADLDKEMQTAEVDEKNAP